MKVSQRDFHQVNLRLPPEMRDQLLASAQKNFRSLTAEALYRIKMDLEKEHVQEARQ